MKRSRRLELFAKAFRAGLDSPAPALSVPSFVGSSAAFAAVTLALDPRPGGAPFTLVVTPGLPEADQLVGDLRVLERECDVCALEFPPALEGDPTSTATRLKTAAVLATWRDHPRPMVVVAPVPALFRGVPAPAAVAAATLRFAATDGAHFGEIAERLTAAGYRRVPEVTAAGEFAVRGGVVDVWPGDGSDPVRAEFFGDDLDSLRVFDPATQTSVRVLESATVPPVDVPGEARGLLDVLPDGCSALWLAHVSCPECYHDVANAALRVYAGDPAPRGVASAAFRSSPLPGFAELGIDAARHPELLDGARGRLQAYLVAAERKGTKVIADEELGGGFEVPGLVVVAKSDRVFASRRAPVRAAAQVNVGARLDGMVDLEPGELVVHLDYGIGRYVGATEVEVDGRRSEVLTIEYADGGKLHVPVTHAHLLSRYVGVKGAEVRLHRLDGKRWTREKADAQRAVQDLAASLLDTQARRAVTPGFACNLDLPGIAEFEAAFPWEETPDQAKAIADVKRDLASTKPMDRLLCGDAGYGKTEVAMRAAFIAAMNGKQTVLLAPTTVLAEQHYETFLARFEGTPIRIETLSRFQNAAAKSGIRARLLSGATDIVIGTHAVLAAGVGFHDLGLVIVDEEQRFGVKDKEHLKRLRATADVLAMSATPIPRTLYLSMTGARDLSLLRTPPRERVAVETKVVRDSDETVRTAIRRELERGGQVFFLHNRVQSLGIVERRLRTLAPGAKIVVAHGQLPAAELSERMQTFSRGAADVLLSTTIVEAGLDIPRANTILVDRADTFGLAELYQLRGRVGRSSRPGHACFLLPPSGSVDEEARERLDALQRHSGLGAGFNVALRDLEIRGAGNLLGREQSGHVAAVGFSLYCQLLQRTVAQMRGEDVPDIVDVSINLDFLDFSPGSVDADADGACLPYDYVEDEAQRMDFHKRIAEAQTMADVRRLAAELADRCGRPPKPVQRLMKLTEFRVRCAEAGIARLDVRGSRAVFYRAGGREVAFVGKVVGTTADRRLASLFTLLRQGVSDAARK